MDQLEATVDISLELIKFINVDLLSKGDYRIAVEMEPSDKIKAFIQGVSRNEYADKPEVKSDGEQMKGWSKTLEVEYKHSRHSLDQLFNIQVTFLVDPAQPIESVNNMELRLKLTLWGVAHRVAKSSPLKVREEMMEALSERVVTVHASVQSGLHWAAPIVFDFCHRCCILIAIHAQMWSLSQPKFWRHYASSAVMNGDSSHLSVAPSSKTTSSVKGYPLSCDSEQQSAHVITSQPTADTTELFLPQGVNHDFGAISNGMSADVSSLSVGSGGISSGDIEHVLFGRALLPTDTLVDFERGRVMSLCKNIFYTLLTAQQSILTAIHQHNPHFNPQINTDSRPEQLDLSGKLRHVMNKVTQCECPDDIVAVVGTNLASLDAENMLLWDEFIKAATVMLCDLDEGGKGGGGMEFLAPNYTLNTHLLTIHHQMMVEKYAEAFFYSYRQKALAAAFASSEMRQQVCEVLRNSAYIRNLPPLPIECEESQLNPDNMPIIFEEIYVENPTDYIVAAVSSSASSPNMTGEEGDKLKDSDNGVIVNGGMSDVVNGTDPSASHLLAEGSLVALNPLTHSRSSSAEQQRLSHLPKASNSTPVLRSPNSPAHLISTKNNSSSPVSTRTYNVISNNRSRSKHVKTDESFCPTCYNWPLVISATTHKPPYSKDHCTNGEGLVNGDSNKAQGHKGARKYRSFSCSTVQSEFEVLLHSELSQQRSTLGQGTTTSSTAETVLISPSFSVHRDRNRRQAKLGCSLLARKSRSSSETTVMQTPEEKIETQRPMFSNPTASQNQWTPAIELDDAHVCERCETRRSVRNMSRIKQAKDLLSQFASELHTTLNTSVPKEASSCSNDVVESRKALANNRPVSPFQAILAGAVESDNVLWSSFLDDVQCSRMEPLLYTRKHINQVKRLRREVESSLMEQKIKLNWYAHLSSVSPSSSAPLSSFACTEPYFNNPPNEFAYHHLNSENIPGCHLVVCVHGLDGNCQDLRTLRTFLLMTMQLPLSKIR
ncbi:uncharacterized protein LOC142346283 [Convolutriloba macropyga]|uniref:uncharacterized protein LOC142346283 n=1 Tax=Convolutriloba macropyga TaxID=536237 RepID=UPI003F51DED8